MANNYKSRLLPSVIDLSYVKIIQRVINILTKFEQYAE